MPQMIPTSSRADRLSARRQVAGYGPGAVDTALALAVFIAAFAALLALHPFSRPLVLDPATWDYMSVRVADGMVPYRDIFLHKTPGAAFLGAIGASVAPYFGAEPVAGAHAAFLVLSAAGTALLFLLCRRSLPILPSLAAAAFLMGFDQWPLATVEGVRPKVATTALGLACLLAADSGRFGIAGVFGGASTLCWQPGVAYLIGVLWRWRQAPNRSKAFVRLVLGSATLPISLLVWLAAKGALGAFFVDTVLFNIHYIEIMAKTPAATIAKIGHEMMRLDPAEMLALPAALIGISMSGALAPWPLLITGFVYLGMSFVSFQAWPDTILFGAPLAALLAAGLFHLLSRSGRPTFAGALLFATAIAGAAAPSAAGLFPPITYDEQARAMRALAHGLDDSDSVIAVSLPEFLIHTHRTSRWPWPYLWFGVDRFVAQRTPGGFDAILQDLERDPPALILLARRWGGPLRKKFSAWAAQRYDRSVVRIYPHTRRPIVVYRLKNTPAMSTSALDDSDAG